MNKNIKIQVPEGAKNIINTLQYNGFEAYVVGGCVRDSILGRQPDDWDITTNALPDVVMELFKDNHKVVPTGLKHGTLTLLNKDGSAYEITTFRIDGKYSDGRHPDEVLFTSLLKDDLSRRDFTINALAYNNKRGIIDYFNGLDDIDNKIIRCVGNPKVRFNEDALRMMRCIRFSAQLGFQIDKYTREAIFDNSNLIQNISIERIRQEFNKIIISDPMKINDLWQLGLLKYFLPEYGPCIGVMQKNPYHVYCVDRHILESMCHIDPEVNLRLTMLLHDICKPQVKTTDTNGVDHFYNHGELSSEIARKILRRMRYDNKTIEGISKLIKLHDCQINDRKKVKRLLYEIGEKALLDLIKVKEADILAQNPEYYQERHIQLEKIKKEIDEVIKENNCFSLKDLKVNGNDLINIGFKPGKIIGETLNYLLEAVIDKPELNEKEELIKLVLNKKINND